MATQDKPGRVLVIMPDSGNRYLSKVYNDAWMIENGFMDKKIETTIGALVRILNKSAKIEYAAATDHVDAVVKRMRDLGVSQIPVKLGEDFVGLIQETALLRPLLAGEIKPTDPISKLVDENYSVVQDSDSIERLNDIFLSGKVALVSDGIRPKYILTKIDLIGFLSLQAGV
jgi:cystathionine beta-synthase